MLTGFTSDELLIVAIGWLIFAAAVSLLAQNRGHSGATYFFVSVALSPLLALLILAVSKPKDRSADGRRPCPRCAEMIPVGALLCRFCSLDLTQTAGPATTAQPFAPAPGPALSVPLAAPEAAPDWSPSVTPTAPAPKKRGWGVPEMLIVLLIVEQRSVAATSCSSEAPRRPSRRLGS